MCFFFAFNFFLWKKKIISNPQKSSRKKLPLLFLFYKMPMWWFYKKKKKNDNKPDVATRRLAAMIQAFSKRDTQLEYFMEPNEEIFKWRRYIRSTVRYFGRWSFKKKNKIFWGLFLIFKKKKYFPILVFEKACKLGQI